MGSSVGLNMLVFMTCTAMELCPLLSNLLCSVNIWCKVFDASPIYTWPHSYIENLINDSCCLSPVNVLHFLLKWILGYWICVLQCSQRFAGSLLGLTQASYIR